MLGEAVADETSGEMRLGTRSPSAPSAGERGGFDGESKDDDEDAAEMLEEVTTGRDSMRASNKTEVDLGRMGSVAIPSKSSDVEDVTDADESANDEPSARGATIDVDSKLARVVAGTSCWCWC